MSEFKTGDTVKLKSGSPLMTVGRASGPAVTCPAVVTEVRFSTGEIQADLVAVSWFHGGFLHTANFAGDMLEHAERKDLHERCERIEEKLLASQNELLGSLRRATAEERARI